jgi:S-formylglutathione hydrolase
MQFAVFTPPQARSRPVPVLYYLPGLTCDEETVMTKGGALLLAAEMGIMLVASDTSPRVPRLPGDNASIEFGLAAGFYVDATEAPWSSHYRMYSYVTRELPALVEAHLPAKPGAVGVCGDSMGGHGALVVAMRNPDQYRSVSAFAPISAPMQSSLGQNAFSRYLGPDRERWAQYDASILLARRARPDTILVDQGSADEYLETQLKPAALVEAARHSGQRLELRMQPGYDHDWYFICTFMADHLRFHASRLGA